MDEEKVVNEEVVTEEPLEEINGPEETKEEAQDEGADEGAVETVEETQKD